MAMIYTSPSSPVGADIRPGVINSDDDLWLFRVPIAAPQLLDGVVDDRDYEGALIPRWEENPETGEWATVQRDLYGITPLGEPLRQVTYSYGGGEYFITQYYYLEFAADITINLVAAVLSDAAGQTLGTVTGNVLGAHTASIGAFTNQLRNEFGEVVGTWGVDDPWSVLLGGDDFMIGSARSDTFHGSTGDDTLLGEAGADTLLGGAGNDVLDGGLGSDVLDGGEGSRDSADYSARTQAIHVTLAGTTVATVRVNGVAEDSLSGVEYLLGGSAADTFVGDGGHNIFAGNAGDDTLLGVAGADVLFADDGKDRLDGGDGIDRVDFVLESTAAAELSGVGVRVTLNGATAAQATFNGIATDTLLNIENLVGSGFDDILTGDSLTNLLFGYLGNDTLDGAGGNDTLIGGDGVDVLNGGTGIDTASFTYTGADPELVEFYDAYSTQAPIALTLAGASAASYTQNGILAGTLRNIENVAGGLGDDTVTGDGLANRLAGDAGADTLNGDGADDILLGDAGDDTLAGAAGNDTLFGGTGADRMDGGAGLDTADFTQEAVSQNPLLFGPSAGISVTLDGSNAAVVSTGDTLLNIENLIGTAIGKDTLTGDSFANTLNGLGGADWLAGRGGADVLDGGSGIDTADFTDKLSAVVVTLNRAVAASVSVGGGAEDALRNVENLIGGSAADQFTGDSAANRLEGRGGNDTLSGGTGNDVLVGGDGVDVLNGGLGLDTADFSDRTGALTLRLQGANAATLTNGGTSEDTLRAIENVIGGSGNDTLTGDAAANTLTGGNGNDRLNGLTGSDVLDGGVGLDRFYFTTALGPANVDTVRGFEAGTDKIHLARTIFTSLSGQGAGTLSNNFFALEFAADADDFIIYDPFNDTLYYDADGSGAGAEVVVAKVLTSGALSASDFVLQ